jgi:hypothetical protein
VDQALHLPVWRQPLLRHDLWRVGRWKLGPVSRPCRQRGFRLLPLHYNYDAAFPTSKYYAFSQASGCPSSGNVFACLVGKDTNALQQANFAGTQASTYGYWAFYPVTDGTCIMGLPSQQLAAKRVNGKKLLVGANANEGRICRSVITPCSPARRRGIPA